MATDFPNPSARNGHETGPDLDRQTENQFPASGSRAGNAELFQTDHGDALKCAIEVVYSEFANSNLSTDFTCCPHCFTERDVTYLHETPVRLLSFDDAARILPSSVNTLGSAEDFNHFLPRVLETWAYGRHYMPEVIPDRIAV